MTLPVPPIDRQNLPSLIADGKAVVRQLVPEWTGIDGPDPGTALVEACAGMVAALVERVNRATDKERLAVLSDLRVWPRPAAPARTKVAFTLTVARPAPVEIPAGTQVAADPSGGNGIGFVTTEDALLYSCTLLNGGSYRAGQYLAEQQTFTGLLSAPGQEIVLTGDDVLLAVLSGPVPDTQITLQAQISAPSAAGPGTAQPAPGQLAWEAWAGTRWVPCEVVEDSTAALTRSGHVTLNVARQQAPTTVEVNTGTAQAPQQWRAEDVGLVRCRQAGNVAVRVALNSLTLSAEMSVLVPVVQADVAGGDALVGVSTGQPGQRFALPAPPLIDQAAITATTAVPNEPPQLWHSVTSLAASGPDDQVFWLDPATGEAVFGLEAKEPGGLRRHGAIPPRRAEVRIGRYLTGGGAQGNVPARSITVLRQPLPPISSVSNPSAATGGTAAENTDVFSDRLPLGWIGPQRVVTAADIEQAVLSSPTGVVRALHVASGGGELLTPFTEVASWTPATTTVRFTNSGASASVSVPDGTQVATATGIVFTTTHAATVAASGSADVYVTQRKTIRTGTAVPGGVSNGAPGQRFRLADYPITGTKPSIAVQTPSAGPQLWTVVETFTASTATDRHVMVNATTGEIAFGVGEYGAIPVAGSVFAVGADYQTTAGTDGNVPVGTITKVLDASLAVTVTNNVPAQGGVNGATAVTAPSGPYGLLVIPALAQAGRLNYNDLLPAPTLRDSVERVTAPLMPPGVTVGVHAPGYQGIGVAATVIPAQSLLPSERAVLKQVAEDALYEYFNPVSGGPGQAGWPFGRPVHLGDAYGVLDRLPGVARVRTVLLYPMSVLTGERGEPTERIDVTNLSTVFSVDHQVTVEDLRKQA